MRARLAALALSVVMALTCAGCSDDAVVLEISTDLVVPTQLDAICVQISAHGAKPFARRYPLGGVTAARLPATLTVTQGAGDATLALVRGYRDGREVVRATTPVQFSGGVVRTPLALERCRPKAAGTAVTVKAELPGKPGARVVSALGQGESYLVAIAPGEAHVAVARAGMLVPISAATPPVPAAALRGLAAADLDGDCDDDVVLYDDAGTVTVWRHDGVGGFVAETVPGDALPGAMALGDLDGDGDIDIVLVGKARARLLVNDGGGRFAEAAGAISPAPDDATSVDIGDFTGDGAPDLLVGQGSAAPAPPKAYANDGAGHLVYSAAFVPEAPLRARAVLLADLDGDLDLDAVVAGIGGAHVLINRGNGRFDDQTFQRLGAVTGDFVAAAAGDLDGDCLPDLALATGSDLLIYKGAATGGFLLTPAPTPAKGVTALSGADLDGDGAMDLVGAGPGGALWVSGR